MNPQGQSFFRHKECRVQVRQYTPVIAELGGLRQEAMPSDAGNSQPAWVRVKQCLRDRQTDRQIETERVS